MSDNKQVSPPAVDPQTQMIMTVAIAAAGPIISKLGITPDQASSYAAWTYWFALNVAVPLGSMAYAAWRNMRSRRIKDVASIPSVGGVLMKTEQAALDLNTKVAGASNDNILGPSEVIGVVSKAPGVAAVVLSDQRAADAHPSTTVLGPAALAKAA